MEEFSKALEVKDCEKILELLDDYLHTVEREDQIIELLEKLEDAAVECESYDLAHEIAHIYAHLNKEEKIIEPYKRILEKVKENEEKYIQALYHLADAYEHFGFLEEAINAYEELLNLERKRGDETEEALTLAHLALAHEELEDLEKAIEFMEQAREKFQKLNDELNYLISLVDLAHFYYEAGKDEKAEELIREVLKKPRSDEIEVNALLVKSEIEAERENYREAFKDISKAMLKALETDENLFLFAFETLQNFLEALFNEKLFEEVYENVDVLVNAFDDVNKDYANFFNALGELAKLKEGQEKAKARFEELYTSIENEELREILNDFKEKGVKFLNIGL
ncbi:hypothetical protein PAP_00515 [Palaeococcus pacificus DY20341]|uniref:Uncharacterized protein n=1 Tax=Palaeococcus pacificus DY20341 TaxID=1343739 RepID=A0A075LQF6_9EURY|nr:tetratricopeptide repeat protein [Palaeococcus pacificus]AIF68549.1 hypothetical protein PAP_00515 [Palaeococcus pacificus DY20341]